jgi:hypothetical protein
LEASQVLYQFNSDDYFIHQLEHMTKELKAISALMDENNRQQRFGRPPQIVVHKHQWRKTPKTPSPALLFPFNVLSASIDSLLNRFDQAVGRWIQEGIIGRWLNRIRFWIKKRKHPEA